MAKCSRRADRLIPWNSIGNVQFRVGERVIVAPSYDHSVCFEQRWMGLCSMKGKGSNCELLNDRRNSRGWLSMSAGCWILWLSRENKQRGNWWVKNSCRRNRSETQTNNPDVFHNGTCSKTSSVHEQRNVMIEKKTSTLEVNETKRTEINDAEILV